MLAATAGVDGERVRSVECGVRNFEFWRTVRGEDREAFERLEQRFGRVYLRAIIGTMRTGNELGLRAARHIGLKNSVGIIKIGDNYGEAAEELLQGCVQRPIPG